MSADAYGLAIYAVRLQSDRGPVTVEILTTGLERAALLACHIENAPRHAVKTITRR